MYFEEDIIEEEKAPTHHEDVDLLTCVHICTEHLVDYFVLNEYVLNLMLTFHSACPICNVHAMYMKIRYVSHVFDQ